MANALDDFKQRILDSQFLQVSAPQIYRDIYCGCCMGTIRKHINKLVNEGFLKYNMRRGGAKWYFVVPKQKPIVETKIESDSDKNDESLRNLYDLIKQISKTQVDKYVELFLQTRLHGIISDKVSEIVKQEFHEEIIPALMTAINNETETKVNESHDKIVKIVLNSERRILAKLSLAAKTFLG